MLTNLTDKQYKIMVVICDGNGQDDDGNFIPVDMEQLLDRLAYRTTKASMQFSIRPLVGHRLIVKGYERRRGRRHVTYTPTKLGRQILGYGGSLPGYVARSVAADSSL